MLLNLLRSVVSRLIREDPPDQPWWYRGSTFFLVKLYHLGLVVGELGCSDLTSPNRLDQPTLSIGNITVGGTGKSPVTIELARMLLEAKHRPAILTRGYKSALGRDEFVVLLNGQIVASNSPKFADAKSHSTSFDQSTASQNGGCDHQIKFQDIGADEALMQSIALPEVPVVVGRRRYEAARSFLADTDEPPTVWLIDDGFQHRKLHRDLDIVLVDYDKPLGNGRLLPAGVLRELPRNLRRADLVIYTRAPGRGPFEMRGIEPFVEGLTAYCHFDCGPLQRISNGKQVEQPISKPSTRFMVMAALANNHQLYQDLLRQGYTIVQTAFLADHGSFAKNDKWIDIAGMNTARMNTARIDTADAVITTAKDYWRHPSYFDQLQLPVYVVPLQLRLVATTLSDVTLPDVTATDWRALIQKIPAGRALFE